MLAVRDLSALGLGYRFALGGVESGEYIAQDFPYFVDADFRQGAPWRSVTREPIYYYTR